MLSLFARRNSAIVAAAVALTVASSALAVDSSYISLTVQASTSSTGPWVNSLNVNSITADDALFYRISANLATAGTTNASAVGLTTADNFTTITSYPNNSNFGLSSVQMNLSSVGSTVVKFTSAATIDPVFGFDVGSGKSGGTFTAGGNTLSNIRAEQGSGPNSFWGAPGGTGFVIATGKFGISTVGGTSTLGLDFSGIVGQLATMRWFDPALAIPVGSIDHLGTVNYSLSSANYTASVAALAPLVSISNVSLVGSGPVIVLAGSGTWHNGGNDGLWGTNTAIGSNWITGIPNAADQDATFDNTVINTPGGLTVDLGASTNRTVRVLNLAGDATHGYNIGLAGTADVLFLSTTTTPVAINVSGGGSNTINAHVTATSANIITVASGSSLKLSGGLTNTSGSTSVTNNGAFVVNSTVTTGAITGTGTTTVGTTGPTVNGTLTATSIRQNALTINGASTATISPNGSNSATSVLSGLTVGATATLDINDNKLIVNNANGAAALATLANMEALAFLGRNGTNGGTGLGNWNGTGLRSTSANIANQDAFVEYQVGVVLNSQLGDAGLTQYTTFGGQPVNANSVLARYTYGGDINLDGLVDPNDYQQIDFGYAFALTGYINGDINYDGVVDPSDYSIIDFSYIFQGGPLAAQMVALHAEEFGAPYITAMDSMLAPAGLTLNSDGLISEAVPEPASLGLLIIGASTLLMKRRR